MAAGKGAATDKKELSSEPFDQSAAIAKRMKERRKGVGDSSGEEGESSAWEAGGYIKKKLLRKQSYRNLNSINNKTSRKKTKLTEVFKSKKNNKKTLRKR